MSKESSCKEAEGERLEGAGSEPPAPGSGLPPSMQKANGGSKRLSKLPVPKTLLHPHKSKKDKMPLKKGNKKRKMRPKRSLIFIM
jgi:hypothetical protein